MFAQHNWDEAPTKIPFDRSYPFALRSTYILPDNRGHSCSLIDMPTLEIALFPVATTFCLETDRQVNPALSKEQIEEAWSKPELEGIVKEYYFLSDPID